MYAERRIIDRVREVLRQQDQTLTPEMRDLAQQYAELRSRIRTRLEECSGFLARGLRSEARHVAGVSPPLLEMARILQAEDLAAWTGLCLGGELPEPPVLPPDLIAMIECALDDESGPAARLATLARSFRRVVLLGSTRESLAILRQIRTLDGKNPTWTEDVRAFEEERLVQVPAECAAARHANEEARLTALAAELAAPGWQIRPAPALVKQVDEALRAVRTIRLCKEAAELSTTIATAHSSMDFAPIEAGLRRWAELEKEADFQPDPNVQRQVEDARLWYSAEVRRRVDEEAFNHAVSNLCRSIQESGPLAELEALLTRASSFQRELPEEVALATQRRLATLRLAQTRRQRWLAFLVAAGLLLTVAGIGFIGRERIRDREYRSLLVQLDAAIQERRWDLAQHHLDLLARSSADTATLAVLAERRDRVATAQRTSRQRREGVDQILQELAGLAASGYRPFEHAESLVTKASTQTEEDDNRLRIERFRTEITAARAKAQQEVDESYLGQLELAERALARLEALDAARELETCLRLLDEATGACARARALAVGVSHSLASRLEPIQESLDLKSRRLQESRDQLQARQAATSALYSSLPDLSAYESALHSLERLANLPPLERDRVHRLLRLLPANDALAEATSWTYTEERTSEQTIQSAVGNAQRASSPFLDALKTAETAIRAWPDSAAAVEDLQKFASLALVSNLRVTTGRPSTEKTARWIHLLEEPHRRSADSTDAAYQAIAVNPVDFKQAALVFYPQTVPPKVELMPHARYARELLERLGKVQRGGVLDFLAQEARTLEQVEGVDPVITVIFMKKFLALGAKIGDEALRPYQTSLQDLDRDADTDVQWLSESKEVLDAKRGLQDPLRILSGRLGTMDTARRAWVFKKELAFRSLNRRLRIAGQVRILAGVLQPVSISRDAAELWLLRDVGPDKPCRSWILADCPDGTTTLRGDSMAPIDGEPLWAPADGRTTQEDLVDAAQCAGMDSAGILAWTDWPAAWPQNERRLKDR
ncbi:MAG: hypothetical protein HZA54_05865 [Planctomycetes bacterium]|nr:hypothetical protein [Planctomycetota bacterium]